MPVAACAPSRVVELLDRSLLGKSPRLIEVWAPPSRARVESPRPSLPRLLENCTEVGSASSRPDPGLGSNFSRYGPADGSCS